VTLKHSYWHYICAKFHSNSQCKPIHSLNTNDNDDDDNSLSLSLFQRPFF